MQDNLKKYFLSFGTDFSPSALFKSAIIIYICNLKKCILTTVVEHWILAVHTEVAAGCMSAAVQMAAWCKAAVAARGQVELQSGAG